VIQQLLHSSLSIITNFGSHPGDEFGGHYSYISGEIT
jgi:hypothetical protein